MQIDCKRCRGELREWCSSETIEKTKNAGNSIVNWWNDLWDKDDSEDDFFDKLISLVGLILLIICGCIIIALLSILVPFFKAVGKGVAFVWNSLKDLFKAAGKSVRKASRSRSGKNTNKKRKKK